MAFLDNRLSVPPVPNTFIGSGSEALLSRTSDFIDGPIAEQDPTQGLAYQQWRAYIKDSTVYVEADNTPPRPLLNSPEMSAFTDISIAFNQNADLHYTYVEQGQAKMYWFDTLTSSFQTMLLPAGIRTPKITLDDKRPQQSGRSDIILSYVKDDHKLYFRMQRERFGVEHLLDDGPFISIERLYMNNGYRLQWLMTRGTV